jgi:hypothetical protein
MLPASSFWRKGFPTPRLPAGVDVAADWGGFVVQKKWQGEPKFSPDEYVAWLHRIDGLTWAAMWDLPCEPELATGARAVAARQRWTCEQARNFVEWYGDEPFAWVPTIQGYDVEDYRVACDDMRPIIEELYEWYGDLRNDDDDDLWDEETQRNPWGGCLDSFRVGIGSLCARKDRQQIVDIVNAVAEELPGVPLHLWGVKLAALSGGGMPDSVVSSDSAAWNGRFGEGMNAVRGSGMTQREYGYRVALPTYHERFEKVVNGRTTGRVTGRRRKA